MPDRSVDRTPLLTHYDPVTRMLHANQRFIHPELKADKLDFSDLSYDNSSDTLWIVSDKGECLFQYDWTRDTILQRLDLTISTGDKPKRIRKPKGVTFDPDRKRLYVVSDRDANLFVFKLHDDS